MTSRTIASDAEWLEARRALLAKEKEMSRLRDELTAARQALPWRRVEKAYTFASTDGPVTLAELFGPHSQLMVYHFMFGPDWADGCKICSMCADHYDPLVVHLAARDVAMVTVSRAPLERLEAYRQRMGWGFRWVSAFENDFNQDFHVSFDPAELEAGKATYNFQEGRGFPVPEAPGVSVFAKDDAGAVHHTYSAYARGLENLLGIYSLLDLVPKGRDEAELPYSMAWVRHHDRYDDESFVDPYA